MITSVIFDVDGVLLDSFEANLKLFQDITKEAGYTSPTREEYRELFHLPGVEVVKRLTKTDAPEEIERVYDLRKKVVRYPIELLSMPEGTDETLAALEQKYTLGIVTSRIRGGLFESPELARLKDHFATVVCYEDTEKHKPEPEPLLLALENLGIHPDEAVYIGDSHTDMHAAQTAGIRFIHYGADGPEGADAATAVFRELPDIIESLENR